LKLIPLEFFAHAMTWLKREVDPKKLFVFGFSRGSEAALLLGADYPQLVNGVIATSPSSVANFCECPSTEFAGSWTLHGVQVVTSRTFNTYSNPPTVHERGEIPVRKIRGPVYLLCGSRDNIWPACDYSHLIWNALSPRYRSLDEFVQEPGAGHFVGTVVPFQPVEVNPRLNPSKKDDELGREDAWPKLLEFLNRASRSDHNEGG
jgi:pimeloyl-ACP methyl ester carboxylesterase